MRLTAENKEKIRKGILQGAADLFRKHGVDDVNLDQVMAAASLTRGAFYAHFKSKNALFAAVVEDQHPLLRMLIARKGQTADELWADMLTIFGGYMSPQYHEQIFASCTLAALQGDVTRAKPEIKQAYEGVWKQVMSEMVRGQEPHSDHEHAEHAHGFDCDCHLEGQSFYMISAPIIEAALVMAVGAVSAAEALSSDEDRARILTSAKLGFDQLIGSARKPLNLEEKQS
ncbi:TetR/AcrR family transcriptional regulator [Lentilitoribacter sp. EG35]|uniref:TetR/AcrR family transcriptional regulator n=1 Tax=Lentilitoribacter sp. EG35 TaxID=3234192 RepID=UPI0034607BD4